MILSITWRPRKHASQWSEVILIIFWLRVRQVPGLAGHIPIICRAHTHNSVWKLVHSAYLAVGFQALSLFRLHAPQDRVLREHTLIRASMAEPQFRSCSKTIPEHPCPNHNSFHVPRAYADQSLAAQTIIPFVFQEHTVTRASMPKP